MTMKCLKYSIIFFYLTLFIFLALYDERLCPKLVRELAVPHPKVIDRGNAWLAMLGIDAPVGTSPVEFGEKHLWDIEKAIKDGKSTCEVISASLTDKQEELLLKGKLPLFYGKEKNGVMAYAINHPTEVASLCRDNSELLHRYEQLHLLTNFTEPLEYGYCTPFPHFSLIRNTQQVYFLRLTVMAGKGDLTRALTELHDDMAFWRLVAFNSRTLISKMISFAALFNDLKFAAELGSSGPLTPPELDFVKEILHPFDRGDVSLAKAFQGEALYSYYGMEHSIWNTSKRWSPERLMIKRNATINRIHAYYNEITRQAALPPQQYAEEQKRHASHNAGSIKIGIRGLYNPIGEILALIADPQLSGYIERGYNMEGLRRLALLKVLAHVERIPPDRMQAFLDAHAVDLGDPYSGKPMKIDVKNGRIYFPILSGERDLELYL
jgi:hypothetical protein